MIRDVEIARIGTYKLSTGTHTFTKAQLAAAVHNAQTGVAPRLAPGHVDPRFNGPEHDGTPALGKVVNLRLTSDGETLLGDYADMPPWLENRLPTAFPGRSIEASVRGDDMAISHVKLLGLTLPGISNLADLQQHLSDEGPLQVAAGEDADGHHIEIVIASTEEAAQQAGQLVGEPKAGPRPDPNNPKESTMDPKALRESIGLAEDASPEDVKARLDELNARPKPDDVTPTSEVDQRVEEAVAAARADERTKLAASRADEVTLDKATHERLIAAAALAEDLNTKTIAASRDQIVDEAVRLGKIEPARKDYWRDQLDADTEHATQRLTASSADGGFAPYSAVPVTEIGASGGLDDDDTGTPTTTGWFPSLQEN